MTELQALCEQIQETRTGGRTVELLQSSDSLEELAALSDIFKHYAADMCLKNRKYPERMIAMHRDGVFSNSTMDENS